MSKKNNDATDVMKKHMKDIHKTDMPMSTKKMGPPPTMPDPAPKRKKLKNK